MLDHAIAIIDLMSLGGKKLLRSLVLLVRNDTSSTIYLLGMFSFSDPNNIEESIDGRGSWCTGSFPNYNLEE